ncbi:MAG TPA: hypothetical protein VJL29_12525 [Thermoguttaceae bacterium]|nr:hypothetical protein [Thermoguttaceae bacterium]
MKLIWLCRYLCFMFFVLSVAAWSNPVTPGSEAVITLAQIVVGVLCITSGGVAVWLGWLYKKDPNRPIFQSKLALAVAMVIAVLGTMLLGG